MLVSFQTAALDGAAADWSANSAGVTSLDKTGVRITLCRDLHLLTLMSIHTPLYRDSRSALLKYTWRTIAFLKSAVKRIGVLDGS